MFTDEKIDASRAPCVRCPTEARCAAISRKPLWLWLLESPFCLLVAKSQREINGVLLTTTTGTTQHGQPNELLSHFIGTTPGEEPGEIWVAIP